MRLGIDVHMDAEVKRLRYKSMCRGGRRSELRMRITQYLSGRVRASWRHHVIKLSYKIIALHIVCYIE